MGINFCKNNYESAVDVTGHKVLGMSGSLTNYIYTGNPNSKVIAGKHDNFIPSRKYQKRKKIIAGLQITSIIAGITCIALLIKGKVFKKLPKIKAK